MTVVMLTGPVAACLLPEVAFCAAWWRKTSQKSRPNAARISNHTRTRISRSSDAGGDVEAAVGGLALRTEHQEMVDSWCLLALVNLVLLMQFSNAMLAHWQNIYSILRELDATGGSTSKYSCADSIT